MPSHPNWISVRIASRVQETADIARFELAPLEGTLPRFEAGSHIDVQISENTIRQYSLCNSPASSGYQIAVLRDSSSRGGSEEIHKTFLPGRIIRISPPRNLFPLAAARQNSLLFAGGIGITPILAMAHDLSRFGDHFALHYFARSEAHAAFLTELSQAPLSERAHTHFGASTESHAQNIESILKTAQQDTELYVCGPTGFIETVRTAAQRSGFAAERFHYERFSLDNDKTGHEFTVVAARSGVTVTVSDGQTIAEALLDSGVNVPLSCEQGICGTCITAVVDGVPDHRDEYLTDDEKSRNSTITVCCSRSKTPRLVLDL